MKPLDNKPALLTGSLGSLARVQASALADAGATVILWDRRTSGTAKDLHGRLPKSGYLPPSIAMICPVIMSEAGETRKTTRSAIERGHSARRQDASPARNRRNRRPRSRPAVRR